MLLTSNYSNMGNAKKNKQTIIHIFNLRVSQYLSLFDIRYYFNISLICSKFLLYFTLKQSSL